MSKYVLGLDIGVASVGWGIIDLDNVRNPVVDAGVRLFAEGTAAANEDRRTARSARRLLRRRNYRLKRMKNLLEKNNIISGDFKPVNNPYEIRQKGLKTKLTNEELATAILHITKRRGLSGEWIDTIDAEKLKEDESTKSTISKNKQLLAQGMHICEIQLDNVKESKIRGENNFFETVDYINEVRTIFKNQNLNPDLEDEIVKIIVSKRDYDMGPGDENSPTKYGRFYFDENGELVETTMIEKMRGKCTVYPSELRAPKMSYAADLFNFLNDLNNLELPNDEFPNGKLPPEEKEEIIKIINGTGKFTFADLKSRYKQYKEEDFKGLRIDKSEKKLLTEFKGLRQLMKYVKDHSLSTIIYEDKNLFDEIIEVLTNQKSDVNRKRDLAKFSEALTTNDIEKLAHVPGISGYHSLSMKAIKEIINDLIETNDNQMQLFQSKGMFGNKSSSKGKKNIQANANLILSPVVKRSQNEALKIVNAVRDRYGELDTIVIEMAREKNSDEKKKWERDRQKKNEYLNKLVLEVIKEARPNFNDNEIGKFALKVRLYMEQEGKCLYTGKAIDLNILLSDRHAYEVDHIIPVSISFDDSYNNKVLVLNKANQEKGQRTPFQYFKNKQSDGWNYEDFKNTVLTNKSIPYKKRNNLLFEKDINSYDVRKDFIARNLVDTRYACRGILNTLQYYFKDNEIETKVHTINGALTSQFRKRARIEKDRDEDFRHHAIDALIVAGIKKMNYLNHLLNIKVVKETNQTFDEKTGEIIDAANEKEYYDSSFLEFVSNLRDRQVEYSHKVDRKPNRQISDATIYSTRHYDDKDYKISKYKDIYGPDGEKLAEMFRKGIAQDKLLMFKHNKDSYALLQAIVSQYPSSEKNPFKKYFDDNKDYIRKPSKDLGPAIKSVKYIDSEIRSEVLDLSSKYTNHPKAGKKAIMTSINPYRIDIYLDGGKYKFMKINHSDVKIKGDKFYVNVDSYNSEKEKRGISSSAEFMFTLNKGDLFYFRKTDSDEAIVRYIGNHYQQNKLEYKVRNAPENPKKPTQKEPERHIAIGTFIRMVKYNSDVLGNLHKCEQETCKMEWDMIQ